MIIYTGTFDIQEVSTTVRVCFTCTFIEGSQLLQQSIDVLSPSIMSTSVQSSQRVATTTPTNGRHAFMNINH